MTTWRSSPEDLEASAQEGLARGHWPHPGSVLGEYMAAKWPDRVPPQCGHTSGVLEPLTEIRSPADRMIPYPDEPTTLTCYLTPGHEYAHQAVNGWMWGNDGRPFYMLG